MEDNYSEIAVNTENFGEKDYFHHGVPGAAQPKS
jgi:hypothetical protein